LEGLEISLMNFVVRLLRGGDVFASGLGVSVRDFIEMRASCTPMPLEHGAGYSVPLMAAVKLPLQLRRIILVMLRQTPTTTLLCQFAHLVNAQTPLIARAGWAPRTAKNAVADGLPFVAMLAAKPVANSRRDVFRGKATALFGLCCTTEALKSVMQPVLNALVRDCALSTP
jgi:hypothetical protein